MKYNFVKRNLTGEIYGAVRTVSAILAANYSMRKGEVLMCCSVVKSSSQIWNWCSPANGREALCWTRNHLLRVHEFDVEITRKMLHSFHLFMWTNLWIHQLHMECHISSISTFPVWLLRVLPSSARTTTIDNITLKIQQSMTASTSIRCTLFVAG